MTPDISVLLTGAALVTVAVYFRYRLERATRCADKATAMPLSARRLQWLADSVLVLLAYATVLLTTNRVLLAALAGAVVALSPEVIDRGAVRMSRQRALAPLVHGLCLVALSRATAQFPDGWRDVIFSVLALAALLTVEVTARGLLSRACIVPPAAPFKPAELLRLPALFPFFLLLLTLPLAQVPWAEQMAASSVVLVVTGILGAGVPPLRRLGVGLYQLQLAVFPTALALALRLNDYVTGFDILQPPLVVVTIAACFASCIASRVLLHDRRGPAGVVRAHRHFLVAGVLFLACLLIFRGDARYHGTGDTRPAELLPIALLQYHSLTFDGLAAQTQVTGFDWGFSNVNGHIVSSYPIVPGLVNTATFAAEALAGGDLLQSVNRASATSAALVASASVALMFGVLLNLFRSTSTALLGAGAFAFGTCVWSVASNAMWQHGPSLLFLLGALFLLTSNTQAPWRVLVAGLLLGLAAWNRPSNIALVIPIAAWWIWQRRAIDGYLLAGLAIPIAAMLLYSYTYYGRIDTFGQLQPLETFNGDPLNGVLGLTLNPNRGLFMFSPVLLLGLIGAVFAVRDWRKYSLACASAMGVVLMLAVYSRWHFWWGGASFGYRLIIEAVPGLIILAALGWQEWVKGSGVRMAGVALALVLSVYIQWLGAAYYPCGFDTQPNGIDQHPERLWDVSDGELSRCTARVVADVGLRLGAQ